MREPRLGEVELQIEEWIAERRFDLAVPAIADLRQAWQGAVRNAGAPEAERILVETGRAVRRLVRLAQVQRARIAAELARLTASLPYLPESSSASTWRVQA